MSWFIGIDPGVNGGLCALPEKGDKFYLFPYKEDSAHLILYAILDLTLVDIKAIALEKVSASGVMGSRSAFTFGANYSEWKTCLRILKHGSPDIEILHPTPQLWQKPLPDSAKDKDPKKRKNTLARYAKEQFPYMGSKLTIKMADAVLIASWAKNQF